MKTRPLSYQFVTKPYGGDGMRKAFVRGTCGSCGQPEDIPWERSNNPFEVSRAFEKRGWEFDQNRIAKCRCPSCLTKRFGAKLRTDMKLDATPEMKPMAVTLAPAASPTLDATPDQKRRIRELLDKHFDDAVGCYLDGKSDQVIGKELGLPWALVARMRELAYGPLRADPEVLAIQTELQAARNEQSLLLGRVQQLERTIDALAGRVERVAKRFSSAA